ncbi:hypothetical protein ACRRTK_024834 [Alexandromys fortis]
MFCFFETGFLCSFGACPELALVDQADLELTEILLPLPARLLIPIFIKQVVIASLHVCICSRNCMLVLNGKVEKGHSNSQSVFDRYFYLKYFQV